MGLDMHLYCAPRVEGLTSSDYRELNSLTMRSQSIEQAAWEFTMSGLPGVPELRNAIGVTDWGRPTLFQEVSYWRKAWLVHNWFVDHVQDGDDDCNTYLVTQEQLQELLHLAREGLHSPKRIPTLFRDAEDDDYNREHLEDTVEQLRKVLATTDFDTQVVLYRSSW